MKILRHLSWLLALLPCAAALAFATLASRVPEEIAARRAQGECAWQWDFASALSCEHEPAHVLARWLHLGMLHIPGATLALSAFGNVLCAALLTLALARLVQRAFPAAGLGHAVVFGAIALLVCSPAHGANWLFGERLGRFLVPLLFVCALHLLSRGPRAGWRSGVAVAAAAAAPFCHEHGVFVFLALVPVLAAERRLASAAALLLVGNVAAFASFWAVAWHGTGFFAGLGNGQFLASIAAVVRATGELWPDVLPGRHLDAVLLGAVSWLSPLLLLVRRRADGAGIWGGCITYALLAVVWSAERNGLPGLADQVLCAQARHEILHAGYLLPLGVVGVLASRLGTAVWPLLGGAFAAVALQGWESGLHALRRARWHVEHIEARVLVPVEIGGPRERRNLPTRDLGELLLLEERGWVPKDDRTWMVHVASAVAEVGDARVGACHGGDITAVRGVVRSRLFGAQFVCVVLGAYVDGSLVGLTAALPDVALPDVDGAPGVDVPWQAGFGHAPPEGAKVVAVGYDIRSGRGMRLAGDFVVHDGKVVERQQ